MLLTVCAEVTTNDSTYKAGACLTLVAKLTSSFNLFLLALGFSDCVFVVGCGFVLFIFPISFGNSSVLIFPVWSLMFEFLGCRSFP